MSIERLLEPLAPNAGLVTVTPEYRVRVSPRLRERWHNGRRYYSFDGKALMQLPDDSPQRPSPQALDWHNHRVFVA